VAVAGCGSDAAETEETSEKPRAAQPQIVVDATEGAEWVAEAMRSSGYRTDFSPGSLWEVDRFFDEQMKRAGKPKPSGLLAEDRGACLFAIGASGVVTGEHLPETWRGSAA
jgi:hypothetical protein